MGGCRNVGGTTDTHGGWDTTAGETGAVGGTEAYEETEAIGGTDVSEETKSLGGTGATGETENVVGTGAVGNVETDAAAGVEGETKATDELPEPSPDASIGDSENPEVEGEVSFYALDCPDDVVLGLYSWSGRIVLYTYNEGRYYIVLMDPDSGEVLARTREGYDHHVWLDFSESVEPDASPPNATGASLANAPGVSLKNSPASGLQNDPEVGLQSNQDVGLPNAPEAGPQGSLPGTEDGNAPAGGDAVFETEFQTERNILIEDGIFNSGLQEDAKDLPQPANVVSDSEQLRIYDPQTRSFMWLDGGFNLIKTWEMPEDVSANPVMDQSNCYVYYVNLDGDIIRLEMATGLAVKLDAGLEQRPEPNLEGIFNHGTLLKASGMAVDDSGVLFASHYMDVVKNKVIASRSDFSSISGREDNYLVWMNNQLSQIVYGNYSDTHISELIFENYAEYQSMFAFPDDERVFTYFNKNLADGTSTGVLSMYCLTDGTKPAAFTVPEDAGVGGNNRPLYMAYLPDSGRVVYAVTSENPKLYVWDTQTPESQSGDNGLYKYPYMAEDAQDTDEMERLKAYAQSLGEQYGVKVFIADDAPTQLWGYKAEHVTSVRLTQRALMILRQALGSYPDGFFEQLHNEAQGPLKFYILCNFVPDGSDSLSTTTGLFGQDAAQQYVALNVVDLDRLEPLIYHEISHAIDNKLFGVSNQTYHSEAWDMLNPEGFAYDFSYQSNAQIANWDHVYGGGVFMENQGTAYFIDAYSKSYPTEDRARIMEYAMGYYPSSKCFGEEYLWKKLEYISRDIREHFDTAGWPEVTWWERALQRQP